MRWDKTINTITSLAGVGLGLAILSRATKNMMQTYRRRSYPKFKIPKYQKFNTHKMYRYKRW